MRYGLILAAGNQSRFKSEIPKALVKINDECLLDKNISNLSQFCDNVYVVCSTSNYEFFEKYDSIIISSGYGCGDAVLKALNKLDLKTNDTVFIQWCDCIIESRVYQTCIDKFQKNSVIIPAVVEQKPYVQLAQCGSKIKVLFSKFGDETTEGFHDLSVFYGNGLYLLNHLTEFQLKYRIDKGYEHIHGNEFNFLDVFNETNINGNIIEIKNYKDISFNSIEDLSKLL